MSLRCGWLVRSAMEWITKYNIFLYIFEKYIFLGHVWTATSGPGPPMVPPYNKKKNNNTQQKHP